MELDEKAKITRAEVLAKAHSVVYLNRDKVLRKVSKETTAMGILEKCEDFYMTKSLANRLFMKHVGAVGGFSWRISLRPSKY